MIGKKLSCAAAFSLALLASPASAQWVVSDPASYMYYVQQIEQQVEMVEKAARQVETLGGVLTTVNKVERNLTGHYNRAVGLVNRMNNLSLAIGRESGGGIFNEAKKWGNVGRQVGGVMRSGTGGTGRVLKDVSEFTGDDLYQDTKAMLDEVFTDPRDIEDPEERHRSASRRYQLQQGALKEVVARSERTLGGIKDRLGVIQELAGMIDKTENQKDAQDLTNRVLIEILAALVDMLQIGAQANQADALLNYRGASDASMKQRQDVLNRASSSAFDLGKILGGSSGGTRF